jgi:hypothetical protein
MWRRALLVSFAGVLAACSSSDKTGAGGSGGAGGAMPSTTGPGGGGGSSQGGSGGGGGEKPITTHPTNILNNGGFEYGLMCFGNWVWSTTGQDYKGDYDFYVSADAHGGKSAIEIRCNGSDCGWPGKAALESQSFHAAAGQGFKLKVFTKCAPGEMAFFYTPNGPSGDFSQNLTCSGDWAANEVDFTTSSANGLVAFSLYYAGTTSGFFDDAVLTFADGTVPVHTVKHPGVRDVSIKGDQVVVDGAPYLALGFYDVPYDELADVHAVGANTVAFGVEPLSDCFNDDRGVYADAAYEHGIMVLPDSTTTARLDTPSLYPTVLGRFGSHQANLAFYMVDEPDQDAVTWYYITADKFVAEHDAAKTATKLPVFSDLQHASWDAASFDAPYAPGVDVFLAEPYGDDFSSVAHAAGVFATMPKRPMWLAQDPITTDRIVPKAYYAIASGSTGILYFTWAPFRDDAGKKAAATQAFAELSSLPLFASDVTSSVTGPAGVAFIARKSNGKTWIISVNPADANAQGSFVVPGLAAGKKVEVKFENRTITSDAGSFSDSFTGVARHVYVID